MKQGWEYKHIKDVAEVIGGSAPKTDVDDFWGGNYYWVTPAELNGSKYIVKTLRTITDKAVEKTNLTLLPTGTVLLSSRAPIGKVCITQSPMYCNQGFKNLMCKKELYNEFAYYYLRYNTDYLQSLGTGATFKEISKRVVEDVVIPVPPLTEQQRIVKELDLLSGIIEKQKTQLKELDTLAQSIFYDMFGDPVENEKRWKVKFLNDICDVRDGTHDSPQYLQHSEYSLVTSKNIVNDGIDFSNVNYISEEDFNNINKRSKVDDGDIIMPMIGTIGNPIIVHIDKVHKFCIKNVALIKFVAETQISNLFLLNLMKCKCFNDYLKSHNKGGTQKFIALGTIRKLKIILPPLPLQQQFSEKISAIEGMKAKVSQSLAETETLFNSRMDYYFN